MAITLHRDFKLKLMLSISFVELKHRFFRTLFYFLNSFFGCSSKRKLGTSSHLLSAFFAYFKKRWVVLVYGFWINVAFLGALDFAKLYTVVVESLCLRIFHAFVLRWSCIREMKGFCICILVVLRGMCLFYDSKV